MNKLTALIEAAKEPNGREWLLAICNKPSHLRNGPDIVAMGKAINALYDEREKAISRDIELCALLEKAEEALDECDNEFAKIGVGFQNLDDALAAIKQCKEGT